jgi:hypothetical protein
VPREIKQQQHSELQQVGADKLESAIKHKSPLFLETPSCSFISTYPSAVQLTANELKHTIKIRSPLSTQQLLKRLSGQTKRAEKCAAEYPQEIQLETKKGKRMKNCY